MSKNFVLRKENVVTRGTGDSRVVLCYDSGLVYQYNDPSNVIAVFEPGKGWLLPKAPYYSSGGWGQHSRGDKTGAYLIDNAKRLVESIGATYYQSNHTELLTDKELAAQNALIDATNKLRAKEAKVLGKVINIRKGDETRQPLSRIKYTRQLKGTKNGHKGLNPIKVIKDTEKGTETFLKGKGKVYQLDAYRVTPSQVTQGDTTVAFRDAKGDVFLNSQSLATTSFENMFLGGESIIQAKVRSIAKYAIPFNVLAAANLKLEETKVIEQGPQSTHKLKNGEERHFTGALLLENGGRRFLMDIDRIEITHDIFNAFFVEVNAAVKSIAEAYESMKPQAVKDAERDGIEVKRQGEWFLIATPHTVKVTADNVLNWERSDTQGKHVLRVNVSHGKGRPNAVFQPRGFGAELDALVCGTMTHSGREHAPLNLGSEDTQEPNPTAVPGERNEKITFRTFKLWRLVGNTTVSNFTIRGDVD